MAYRWDDPGSISTTIAFPKSNLIFKQVELFDSFASLLYLPLQGS